MVIRLPPFLRRVPVGPSEAVADRHRKLFVDTALQDDAVSTKKGRRGARRGRLRG